MQTRFPNDLFSRLRRILLTGCLAIPLASGPAWAVQPPNVDALTKQLAELETLAADFEQTRLNSEGRVVRESTGTFVMQRPGRFYWRYETPYVQELVAKDDTLWVYEPDLRQASRSSLDAVRGAPIAILMGDRPVDELFRIRPLEGNAGMAWFALRPKGEQGDFQQVLLGVDEKGIKEMRFIDQLDQTTRVDFRDRRFNQPVDEDRFVFEVPTGTDVVEASQPPGLD